MDERKKVSIKEFLELIKGNINLELQFLDYLEDPKHTYAKKDLEDLANEVIWEFEEVNGKLD